MVFVTGNTCFVQPSLSCPFFPSSSSRAFLLHSFPRNAESKPRRTLAMASAREDDSTEAISCQRRAYLFVAISVIPFLKLSAGALDPPLLAIRKRARALDSLPTTSKLSISHFGWDFMNLVPKKRKVLDFFVFVIVKLR